MGLEEERRSIEKEHFDRLAEEHGEVWWGSVTAAGVERLRRRARLLAENLQAYADPRVLELGCGTGAFSQHILAELPSLRLDGIDVSPKCVAVAAHRLQRYPHARFNVGNALALDYSEASFDAVVGNSVLHHVPLERCVAEVLRVLKPEALFWFSEPNMMNPQIAVEKNVKSIGKWLQNTPHETAFFRWSLSRSLTNAGFRHVSVRPFDFLHPIVPRPLISPVGALGMLLERIPLVREISGSLLISAVK